ncbi:Clavaminate synthase-like protein [Apiospora aurea]|uniref:Clavaminate synthase-like protein n=1 Tax=Apiospora aurea TaxID=335848 RepID=A0ABR1PYQ1_9PEZI
MELLGVRGGLGKWHQHPLPRGLAARLRAAGHDGRTGRTTDTLEIPEVDYYSIFPTEEPTERQRNQTTLRVVDMLFHEGKGGLVKIVNTPPADVASERNRANTIVTKVLKQLFGSVFAQRTGRSISRRITAPTSFGGGGAA